MSYTAVVFVIICNSNTLAKKQRKRKTCFNFVEIRYTHIHRQRNVKHPTKAG